MAEGRLNIVQVNVEREHLEIFNSFSTWSIKHVLKKLISILLPQPLIPVDQGHLTCVVAAMHMQLLHVIVLAIFVVHGELTSEAKGNAGVPWIWTAPFKQELVSARFFRTPVYRGRHVEFYEFDQGIC